MTGQGDETPLLGGVSTSSPKLDKESTMGSQGDVPLVKAPSRAARLCAFFSYSVLLKLAAVCLLIAVLVLVVHNVDLSKVQTAVDYYRGHRLKALPLFLAFNVISVVLFLPGVVPQLIAGAIFGFGLGTPAAWIGTCVGQTCAFALGRYLLREQLHTYIARHYPKLWAVENAIFKDGQPWKMLFLLRVAPVVPDSVLNYSLAVTSVPLLLFGWVSAVALLPYSMMYAYVGSASSDIIDTIRGGGSSQGRTHGERMRQLALTLVSLLLGVVAVVYVIVVVKRALAQALADAEAEQEDLESGGAGGILELERSPGATETTSLLRNQKRSRSSSGSLRGGTPGGDRDGIKSIDLDDDDESSSSDGKDGGGGSRRGR